MAAHHKCNMDDFNLELRQMTRRIALKTIGNNMPDFDSEPNQLIGIAITLPYMQ
jgi:hypothetical protein